MDIRGIVLAGGTGSRLLPLTKVTNKHLLPVGRKPMIFYPIEKLVGAGVEEILVVTGVEHMGAVVNLLGSGKDFNCRLTYKVQDEAGGIAQALALSENFVHDSPMMVILGDNIFEDDLKEQINAFGKQSWGARILLKEVNDPQRFGVAEITNNTVIDIEEKPAEPKSNYAVTGIYFYHPHVFHLIQTLVPSSRGELEITDLNKIYIKHGSLTYGLLKGWWTDAGTFESLTRANKLVAEV